MSKENEEAQLFQNWFWGKIHPHDFLIIWANSNSNYTNYRELGLLCGVTESTVQHWFGSKTASSYTEPAERYQRLLVIFNWWLLTFEQTPTQIIASFESDLQQ